MTSFAFEHISLKDLDRVKLLNRFDLKFWFHIDLLQDVLDSIKDDYYMLNVDGINLIPYATFYYDTVDSNMYLQHHNGKKSRYKIRKRTYVNTDLQFLEMKYKDNKGKTFKSRIQTKNPFIQLNQEEQSFIDQNSPYQSHKLNVSLYNEFSRITLVNKNFEERCTIDLGLVFRKDDNRLTLSDMVIIEIKSDRGSASSKLKQVLRDQRIKPNGFSKYCIGSALISPSLKQNKFKSKIRTITKNIAIGASDYLTA